jgi:purine-binding chemotaxis protein CheW
VLNVGKRVVGAVVDSVSDVLALTGADIRPPPEMGPAVAEAAIIGLSTLDQRMLMIVDIEQCMSSPAMQLVG